MWIWLWWTYPVNCPVRCKYPHVCVVNSSMGMYLGGGWKPTRHWVRVRDIKSATERKSQRQRERIRVKVKERYRVRVKDRDKVRDRDTIRVTDKDRVRDRDINKVREGGQKQSETGTQTESVSETGTETKLETQSGTETWTERGKGTARARDRDRDSELWDGTSHHRCGHCSPHAKDQNKTIVLWVAIREGFIHVFREASSSVGHVHRPVFPHTLLLLYNICKWYTLYTRVTEVYMWLTLEHNRKCPCTFKTKQPS